MLANPAVFGQPGTTPTTTARASFKSSSTTARCSARRCVQRRPGPRPATGGAARGAPTAPQAADAFGTGASTRATPHGLSVRTNFNALALFSPSVRTDATGVAHVNVDLPDNLTRYRVMAVAADNGGRFGGGESTLTARLPLQIRPSPPRFANFGDSFELPVVVQNQTDQEMVADVVAETVESHAHRRARIPREGARQRSGRGAVPGRRPTPRAPLATGSARRHGTDADSASGRVPRLHAGHHRSLRDLRRGRQRRDRAAPADPDRGGAPVRRARDRHVVDRDAGPHRRGRVPQRLSVRERRRVRVADHRAHIAARRVRRLRRGRRADPAAGRRAHQLRHQGARPRSRTTTADSARGPATAIPSPTSACRPPKRSCSRGSPGSRCPTAPTSRALAYIRDIESKFPAVLGHAGPPRGECVRAPRPQRGG